jgi:hypothetical protein
MYHYVLTRPRVWRPPLSLGILSDPAERWERKARNLRIRRERKIKRLLRM